MRHFLTAVLVFASCVASRALEVASPDGRLVVTVDDDGGRALYLLAAWAAGPAAGETAARWAGVIAALALSAVLAFVMVRTGGSLWLLPAAAGLLAAAGRELAGQDLKYS